MKVSTAVFIPVDQIKSNTAAHVRRRLKETYETEKTGGGGWGGRAKVGLRSWRRTCLFTVIHEQTHLGNTAHDKELGGTNEYAQFWNNREARTASIVRGTWRKTWPEQRWGSMQGIKPDAGFYFGSPGKHCKNLSLGWILSASYLMIYTLCWKQTGGARSRRKETSWELLPYSK